MKKAIILFCISFGLLSCGVGDKEIESLGGEEAMVAPDLNNETNF